MSYIPGFSTVPSAIFWSGFCSHDFSDDNIGYVGLKLMPFLSMNRATLCPVQIPRTIGTTLIGREFWVRAADSTRSNPVFFEKLFETFRRYRRGRSQLLRIQRNFQFFD